MIKIIQRKDVTMPRVYQIRIVRSSSGVYEVDANEVDADVNRDAADCGCCCDGHRNLIHLPVVKIADMNPFSTLMMFPQERMIYMPSAILTALETKFDLDVCQEDAETFLSLIDF